MFKANLSVIHHKKGKYYSDYHARGEKSQDYEVTCEDQSNSLRRFYMEQRGETTDLLARTNHN